MRTPPPPTHTHTHTTRFTGSHTRTLAHAPPPTHARTRTPTRTRAHAHSHTLTRRHAHSHTHTHSLTRTHPHTHTVVSAARPTLRHNCAWTLLLFSCTVRLQVVSGVDILAGADCMVETPPTPTHSNTLSSAARHTLKPIAGGFLLPVCCLFRRL